MQPADQQLVNQLADAIRNAATAKETWLAYVPAVSAAIAALLSLLSIWLTSRLAREARGNKLLPTMVFYRGPEAKWILKNVGEGTALNVSILNYSGDQLKDELQLYPVGPGQQIRLDYLRGADKLVANYVNLYGQDAHYTICAMNDNGLKAGKFEGKPSQSFSQRPRKRNRQMACYLSVIANDNVLYRNLSNIAHCAQRPFPRTGKPNS